MTGRSGPFLMGIVNVTPDSFSDGGRHVGARAGADHALRLLDEGADLVDVGGESTRPGAAPVPADEEIARVVPVVRGILEHRPTAVVSVDTSKAVVARAAIEAGASWVNDVTALADPEMPEVVARAGVTCVLMHMRGRPETMQRDTAYADLVAEVASYLRQRVAAARRAGIGADRIVIDPGVGFGKDPADNPRLIAAVPTFAEIAPVLIGASRKAFVGKLTGVSAPDERVAGSVGAALAAVEAGASVLRVHDVAATRQALTVFEACRGRA